MRAYWNVRLRARLDGRLTPMNRTDRLLAIVLELQRKGQQRAEDLAVTFEVSTRTIYRDMQALSEAGVPNIAIQKKGYSLSEGYFLPQKFLEWTQAPYKLISFCRA